MKRTDVIWTLVLFLCKMVADIKYGKEACSMARRNSGLNFRKRRRKINIPLLKEILFWVVEIAIVIVIAYVMVSFFGHRTSVVGQAMETTLENGE